MKTYAEARRVIRESELRVGDKVLLKNEVKGKLIPKYMSEPFEVVARKGSMITAQRGRELKTRNSSKFKAVDCSEPVVHDQAENDDVDEPLVPDTTATDIIENEQVEMPICTPVHDVKKPVRPQRIRSRPAYLKDYV
jgi:hypothetical protein